jgi:hypothetical protein
MKGLIHMLSDEPRQRRLAHAGRPPQNHRRDAPTAERQPQRFALTHEVLLTHHIIQCLRSQQFRQWQRRTIIP